MAENIPSLGLPRWPILGPVNGLDSCDGIWLHPFFLYITYLLIPHWDNLSPRFFDAFGLVFGNWFLLSCSTLLRGISLVKIRCFIGVWWFAILIPNLNDHSYLSHPFLRHHSWIHFLSSRAKRLVSFDQNRECHPYLNSSWDALKHCSWSIRFPNRQGLVSLTLRLGSLLHTPNPCCLIYSLYWRCGISLIPSIFLFTPVYDFPQFIIRMHAPVF